MGGKKKLRVKRQLTNAIISYLPTEVGGRPDVVVYGGEQDAGLLRGSPDRGAPSRPGCPHVLRGASPTSRGRRPAQERSALTLALVGG